MRNFLVVLGLVLLAHPGLSLAGLASRGKIPYQSSEDTAGSGKFAAAIMMQYFDKLTQHASGRDYSKFFPLCSMSVDGTKLGCPGADIEPNPGMLVRDMTRYSTQADYKVIQFDSTDKAFAAAQEELKENRPVIALIKTGTFTLRKKAPELMNVIKARALEIVGPFGFLVEGLLNTWIRQNDHYLDLPLPQLNYIVLNDRYPISEEVRNDIFEIIDGKNDESYEFRSTLENQLNWKYDISPQDLGEITRSLDSQIDLGFAKFPISFYLNEYGLGGLSDMLKASGNTLIVVDPSTLSLD